jgi:hypothetical protein
MRLDERNDAHPDPVGAMCTLPEVSGRASQIGPPCPGWLRTYTRLVGGIQCLYAVFFGWMAEGHYSGGRFYHEEDHFKGYSPAYFDYGWLIFTTNCALLFLSGLISGYGLLRLRPWVRRWEVAYLGILTLVVVVSVVGDWSRPSWNSEELTYFVLFYILFGLFYVPFLFDRVIGVIGARPLGAPGKKKPAGAAGDEYFR